MKKIVFNYLVIAAFALSAAIVTSCGKDEGYTVTFDSNGGSAVAAQTVDPHEKVTEPSPIPTKENHTFDGWYTDNNTFNRKWNFANDIVTGNITLYAKWQTGVWTQKADFAGGGRNGAVGFSIGNRGYIGTGVDNAGGVRNDFWEYDPVSNIWTQKANFAGGVRTYAVGFSIGNKGYIGTGYEEDFLIVG